MKCRLISLALLVFAAASIAACVTPYSPKAEPRPASRAIGFNFILRHLGDPNATNCGTAELDRDRSAVDTCVVSAFRTSRPFFAVYDEFHEGMEDGVSAGANGFLSTKAGVIFFLRWEFAPYAHYGNPPAETLKSWPCSQPRIVSGATGIETLACW